MHLGVAYTGHPEAPGDRSVRALPAALPPAAPRARAGGRRRRAGPAPGAGRCRRDALAPGLGGVGPLGHAVGDHRRPRLPAGAHEHAGPLARRDVPARRNGLRAAPTTLRACSSPAARPTSWAPTTRCPAATPRSASPRATRCSARRLEPPAAARASRRRSSAWAASGAPSASSGRPPASYSTAVGYAGGHTPNPTYEEVCSARTGHTEVVLVVFDPAVTSYAELLKLLGGPRPDAGHAPGQRRRHPVPLGDLHHERRRSATAERHARRLPAGAGRGAATAPITTEIAPLGDFFYAEDYHQQYLHKVPNGYCGIGGTGVSCPVGLATACPPAPDPARPAHHAAPRRAGRAGSSTATHRGRARRGRPRGRRGGRAAARAGRRQQRRRRRRGLRRHGRARRHARPARARAAGGVVALEVAAGEPWEAVVERRAGRRAGRARVPDGHPGVDGGDADPERRRLRAGGRRRPSRACACFDRRTGAVEDLAAQACGFRYRTSVFKGDDRRVVLGVTFALRALGARGADPLRRAGARARRPRGRRRAAAAAAREPCSALRRAKGMVVDPGRPRLRERRLVLH